MKHNFSWCSTGSKTLACCVKCRSLRISDRDDRSKASYCHPVLGSTDTHTGPSLAQNFQFSLAETAQSVTLCSWCCMEGISLLITPATIWSPIYPDLWMCLVRDSALFTFLAQILIGPIQLLYFPSFTEHGPRIRNFTHTLCISFQYPDCFLFLQCLTVCLTILCRFLSYTWYVRPFLAVSWQPHWLLLPHIWAAGSVVPCFELPPSQRSVSNPSLVLS